MAVRWSAGVWRNSRHSGNDLLILLALADSANDDTGLSWPSTKSLAKRARIDQRSARRCLRRLEESGELATVVGAGPHGTNSYRLSAGLVDHNYATQAPPDKLSPPPPDTGTTSPRTQVSPEPLVEPSINERVYTRGIRSRGPLGEPPAHRDPWDPPEDLAEVRQAKRRMAFWKAFCAGIGITPQSPGYLAIEARNRIALPGMVEGAHDLEPETFQAATEYLVARWRAGGIRATPSIERVFEAIGEYTQWLADGKPALKRRRGKAEEEELPLEERIESVMSAAEYRVAAGDFTGLGEAINVFMQFEGLDKETGHAALEKLLAHTEEAIP